jgi:lipopolysaccharide/colanic/teichoic acid biosynthesis glycosyltransferase
MGRAMMRRIFNLSVALAAMVVTSPVWALASLWIKLEDGGPVFFRQDRAGRGGVIFRIFKFRTMVVDADKRGLGLNVERTDPRITRAGAFLRRWSLDELPQLLNVIHGDMNVVGPRPGLPEQASKYDARQRRRLEVLPGLTGWAQVNGRNALTWSQRIDADVWYVDHQSVLLDMRILARTPFAVIDTEGLYEPNAGLDDEFNAFGEESKDEERLS